MGYKDITYHMIFDVIMDFIRKARFMEGGQHIKPQESATYKSVVLRDSVRVASILESINDL